MSEGQNDCQDQGSSSEQLVEQAVSERQTREPETETKQLVDLVGGLSDKMDDEKCSNEVKDTQEKNNAVDDDIADNRRPNQQPHQADTEKLNEDNKGEPKILADSAEQGNTEAIIEAIEAKESIDESKQTTEKISADEQSKLKVSDQQEVSSTKNDHHNHHAKSARTSRRPSYQSGRSYAGNYQNYGLTYLPYKSNFEPSEDARRRADEFCKTLKL